MTGVSIGKKKWTATDRVASARHGSRKNWLDAEKTRSRAGHILPKMAGLTRSRGHLGLIAGRDIAVQAPLQDP